MRFKTTGQSMLEYTVIVVLLLAALGTMGKFLKGSINAHFKMLSESVNDAANEQIGRR